MQLCWMSNETVLLEAIAFGRLLVRCRLDWIWMRAVRQIGMQHVHSSHRLSRLLYQWLCGSRCTASGRLLRLSLPWSV